MMSLGLRFFAPSSLSSPLNCSPRTYCSPPPFPLILLPSPYSPPHLPFSFTSLPSLLTPSHSHSLHSHFLPCPLTPLPLTPPPFPLIPPLSFCSPPAYSPPHPPLSFTSLLPPFHSPSLHSHFLACPLTSLSSQSSLSSHSSTIPIKQPNLSVSTISLFLPLPPSLSLFPSLPPSLLFPLRLQEEVWTYGSRVRTFLYPNTIPIV